MAMSVWIPAFAGMTNWNMNRFLQIFKIPELRNKILIVAGLLVAYRLLAAIPIPGIDATKLQNYFTGAACNVKRWLRRLGWEMGQATVAGPSLAATAQ